MYTVYIHWLAPISSIASISTRQRTGLAALLQRLECMYSSSRSVNICLFVRPSVCLCALSLSLSLSLCHFGSIFSHFSIYFRNAAESFCGAVPTMLTTSGDRAVLFIRTCTPCVENPGSQDSTCIVFRVWVCSAQWRHSFMPLCPRRRCSYYNCHCDHTPRYSCP